MSIEAYSNFPSEEEIILPPTSRLRLERVIEKSTEEHLLIEKQVQRKYEFTWIGNDILENNKIVIDMPNAYEPTIKNINLMEIINDVNIKYISIVDRLSYFRDTYVNINNQFISTINNHDFIFNFESYDSSSVYKPFFYYEISDGIMITSSNPRYGNINILLN